MLHDERLDEPQSGEYEGFVRVDRPGRYHGYITVANTGKATAAKPVRRLRDSKDGQVSLKVKAPSFVRVIPFYFDAGRRPEPKDVERQEGLTTKFEYVRPRKTRLVSAKRPG